MQPRPTVLRRFMPTPESTWLLVKEYKSWRVLPTEVSCPALAFARGCLPRDGHGAAIELVVAGEPKQILDHHGDSGWARVRREVILKAGHRGTWMSPRPTKVRLQLTGECTARGFAQFHVPLQQGLL